MGGQARTCGYLCRLWHGEDTDAMDNTPSDEDVRDELADVFIYLVQIADKLGIDLIEAAHAKIIKNSTKYPVS